MKLKQNYSIKKALLRLLPLAMLMGAPSCKKQPLPEPEHHNVVIDWDWSVVQDWAPPADMVKKYTNDKYVDTIFIKIYSGKSYLAGPKTLRRSRDSLQKRLDLATHNVIRGQGVILVDRYLPNYEPQGPGMAVEDSAWFNSHGWQTQIKQYKGR